MCLIAYAPDAQLIPRDVFLYARNENPDGIGVMSRLGVFRFLGPKAGKRAWKCLRTLSEKGVPYGIHFRWATHGAVTRTNCHPFRTDSGQYVMHNGVIHKATKEATHAESDTAVYVRRYMHDAPPGCHAEAVTYYRDVERDISWGNKLLVMHPTSTTVPFTIVNEEAGEWIGGVWYSNTYSLPDEHKPRRRYTYEGGYSINGWQWDSETLSFTRTPSGTSQPIAESYIVGAPAKPGELAHYTYEWDADGERMQKVYHPPAPVTAPAEPPAPTPPPAPSQKAWVPKYLEERRRAERMRAWGRASAQLPAQYRALLGDVADEIATRSEAETPERRRPLSSAEAAELDEDMRQLAGLDTDTPPEWYGGRY